MVAVNDGMVSVEAVRSVQSLSNDRMTYRAAGRPAANSEIGRLPPVIGEPRRAVAEVHLVKTVPLPRSLGQSHPGGAAAPNSALLAMVVNELRSTLRMAEAFRQTVASAEPPAAYAHFASRVYALEVRAQQEISRLRAEGVTTSRQWFA